MTTSMTTSISSMSKESMKSMITSFIDEYKLENHFIKNIEEELENISITSSNKEEFLKIVMKFIHNIHKPTQLLKFLESSGSSIVILSPDAEYVCQYYVNIDVYNKIRSLITDIKTNTYIVEAISFSDDDKSIYWKKITTLNSLSNLKEFILKNIDKLISDISIALNIIHNSGYIHGDCSLDNVGINEYGNFCLFDFDCSSRITSEKSSNDFRIFYKSIDFHTREDNL
jgi:hypothetical protein